MRFRHLDHSLHKTLAFAGVHLVNAVLVGWWLTGSFALASLIALVEPAVNSIVHYRLDHWWNAPQRRRHGPLARTGVFAVAHLLVVLAVGGAITGSVVLAGVYALVEPAANTVAHFFFERWWSRRRTPAAQRLATAG